MKKCNLCMEETKGLSNQIDNFNIKITLCNKCYKQHEPMILGEEVDFNIFFGFMKKIRDNLAYSRRVLHDCLYSWWSQVISHYKYGQNLLKTVNLDHLKSRLESNKKLEILDARQNYGGPSHIANGETEERLGNLLAILHYEHHCFVNKKLLNSSTRP